MTRFRHEWSWNCLGESAARRPRPHVQRHLSGLLTEPANAAHRHHPGIAAVEVTIISAP
ncbi:hypothetical protein [Streptomyces subrutilus]|uniref:hypothetical protein n=1 Tax=Streptomyces subrutilus TaxID=36818 RepID=UPI003F53F78E